MTKVYWQETHTYKMDSEEYKKFLDDYCSTCEDTEKACDVDSVRDALIDWITGKCPCEIVEDDTNYEELTAVCEDVNERLDPHGYYAEKREIEEKLSVAVERVNRLREELEKLEKRMEDD